MTSLADFKNMTNEEKCYFMNARMKNKSKKTFKDEEVTFTFVTAEKVLKENEIYEIEGVWRTAEQAVAFFEEKKKEQDKPELSAENIENLLKLLEPDRLNVLLKLSERYNYISSFILREENGIKIKVGEGNIKNTTMRVYEDTLEKWQEFTKEHKEYGVAQLLNTALVEFMERHY